MKMVTDFIHIYIKMNAVDQKISIIRNETCKATEDMNNFLWMRKI